MLNYRKRIYAAYLSNIFDEVHSAGDIEKEYAVYDRYFRRNYRQYLPSGREAAILDVGCGMGHFLHFLKQAGYKNASGVDGSPDIVAFCKKQGLAVDEGICAEGQGGAELIIQLQRGQEGREGGGCRPAGRRGRAEGEHEARRLGAHWEAGTES